MGMRAHKYVKKEVKPLLFTGIVISVLSALSVAFLTNLEFLSIGGYLILGATVSFIPISETANRQLHAKAPYNFILNILALFLLHRAMVVCGYANEADIKLTIDLENIIRVGPTKGIVASLQKCNEVKGSLSDWEMFVDDDSILVVVPWMPDSTVYVNPTAKISTFSTINTPTYDENLLTYWNMYPEKIPTVIAVEAWNGQISVDKNTWIMKWIDDNYTAYEDGEFWRFYRNE